MKIDKSKLYADMSLKDRASIAFKLTAKNDDLAINELLSTIPKKTIIMNAPAFSLRSTGLYHTAIVWGFEYQKLQGSYLLAMGMIAMPETEDERLNKMIYGSHILFTHIRDKLTILFSLLDELDKSHGLDAKSVYTIAEVSSELVEIDHTAKDKNQALMNYYATMKELFITSLTDFERSGLSEY